jgi:LPS-assembly lipoprotein
LILFLSSCGFQLRGVGKTDFPSELSQMRVSLAGDPSRHAPIVTVTKQALNSFAGVTLVDGAGVPHLQLSDERFANQVLSVGSTAKVSEYLLKYQVSYQLYAADGRSLTERRTVMMQKDYSFDRFNVLAKEQEETELRAALQRDAARRIVSRLAALTIPPTVDP